MTLSGSINVRHELTFPGYWSWGVRLGGISTNVKVVARNLFLARFTEIVQAGR